MNVVARAVWLYVGLVAFIVLIGWWQGAANISLLVLQAMAFALVALGLNIQFGYGGLFNFGIMGFLMVGGFAVTFISYPLNMKFWDSEGPLWLLRAFIAFAAGFALVWAARRAPGRAGLAGGAEAPRAPDLRGASAPARQGPGR